MKKTKHIYRPTDKDGRKRSIRVPGTVDFHTLGKKPVRWRRLQNIKDESNIVIIYGYCAFPPDIGPWFGWAEDMIQNAPCTHCGRINIFNREDWTHECPGMNGGFVLPCLEPHPCEGQPTMGGGLYKRYLFDEWRELRLKD